jgi:peptidyl-prolyl cis-trans isomerase A (cyclophilin A)
MNMSLILKQESALKSNLLLAALAATLLAACGGSEDGPRSVAVTPPPVTSNATITSVTPAGALKYGQAARFTVVGTNLSSGVTLSSAGCFGSTTEAGATATQVVLSCTPVASGAISIAFAPTNGATQATVTPTVPVPQVRMVTSMGTFDLELYPNNTPVTVANFMRYVSAGFYSGKIFHRVISNFVVQGGGFDASLTPAATQAPIALEVGKGLSNVRGTIAMARTSDLNSATSQFFINVVDNTSLDTSGGGYAVFGKVIAGMDVVDAIRVVPTTTNATLGTDVPVTPVTITSATQIQ